MVPVFSMSGRELMPCSPAKARMLIKHGKAVPQRGPVFSIRLTTGTGESRMVRAPKKAEDKTPGEERDQT